MAKSTTWVHSRIALASRCSRVSQIAQEDQTSFGYSIADVGSLVAMAWAMGSMARVVNIGVHVLKYSIPRGTTVKDYFQSVKHKVMSYRSLHLSTSVNPSLAYRFRTKQRNVNGNR
jgi:hypothetical protein